MKTCRMCNETKSEEHFVRSKKSNDGMHPWCSSCKNKKDVEYRRKSRQRKRNREKFGLYLTDDEVKNLIDNGVLKDD